MDKKEIIREKLKEKHKALLKASGYKGNYDYKCFTWDLTVTIIHDLFNELQFLEQAKESKNKKYTYTYDEALNELDKFKQ